MKSFKEKVFESCQGIERLVNFGIDSIGFTYKYNGVIDYIFKKNKIDGLVSVVEPELKQEKYKLYPKFEFRYNVPNNTRILYGLESGEDFEFRVMAERYADFYVENANKYIYTNDPSPKLECFLHTEEAFYDVPDEIVVLCADFITKQCAYMMIGK